MELKNFKLEAPTHAIALEAFGFYWDLHNDADFEELRYFTVENAVELHLAAGEGENPWADKNNRAKGVILKFSEVRLLKIVQTDPYNTNEDDCIAGISKVAITPTLKVQPAELRVKREWNKDEDFGLLFELQSGRTIEIHAASAELIRI